MSASGPIPPTQSIPRPEPPAPRSRGEFRNVLIKIGFSANPVSCLEYRLRGLRCICQRNSRRQRNCSMERLSGCLLCSEVIPSPQ